ncbi:6-bladed beta-propeller [Rhodohalobacter mucosus]|uniref:6-bladed beta-propeller protein n=1 Tax=Rhodohalobacter mucosus TaxID=2079485 RepID=A0A316TT38_9BACT|nr:6-bladed beta-propeller [Rhodohalobacter mucosus]PWN06509.1 hypothetical protein DDZ15_08280 [Rhodohalobacter mucosus]
MNKDTLNGLKFRYGNLFLMFVSATVFLSCSSSADDSESANSLDLVAVEELRIGQMEGDEEVVFGAINGIAVGAEGRIYVSDYQVPTLRMYDSGGNFLGNVGREGRGPGEYLRIAGVKTFTDGELAIWDGGNQRITTYEPDGSFQEHFPLQARLSAVDIFEVDTEGNFYVRIVLRSGPGVPNWEYGWVRVSAEGAVVDTLQVPPDLNEYPQTFVLFTASGDAHAFIEREMFALSPMGYLVTGRNTEYDITLHKPEGEVSIQRDYEPIAVREEEKTQWRKWIDYYNVTHQVPDNKPVFKKIMTDMEGRIWVWRYTEAIYTEENIGPHFGPESNWWEPPTFDVFNPDGSFYARVELPMRAKFFEARGNHVWALVKGEFDEQYVVRYLLEEQGKAIQ